MYNFIDTIEASGSALLPSEALRLNGEYIENLIEGYRTLTVSGRESLSPEITTFETGIRDGATRHSKRYPPRIIIVKYQIISKTNEDFRTAYNKLGGLLDVVDAQMIFNDEPDKYFIGTPSVIGDVEPGRNAVVGEIEFLCTDPFKYSVQEYEAEASLDASSILIDYNGTYKAYPTLISEFYNETEVAEDGLTATALTGNGDCGYVAFFTENEKIIQLGDPEEADGANDASKSQTLMNQTFKGETAWGTTAKKLWSVNTGVIPAEVTQEGGVAMGAASYISQNDTATTGTLIKIRTSTGSPLVNYAVTAKTSNRTADSVKVTAIITTSLEASSSGIGTNRTLEAAVLIGGYWHGVTIKKASDHWQKGMTYTTNLEITVTGLSESTTTLSDIQFKVDRADSLGQAGILEPTDCNDLAIPEYVENGIESWFLFANDHGDTTTGWHGPSITRQIGADASGEVGAANFTFTWAQKMSVGNTDTAANERGGFHCHLSDASGNVIAGMRLVKTQAGNRQASLMLFVNGQKVHQVGIDLSYSNQYFGSAEDSVGTSTIRKSGETVYFTIGGYSQTFNDDAIADSKVTQVTFMFERYAQTDILTYNGLYSAKFVKNNCSSWREVPNKFSANDVLLADCRNGEIILNGVAAPELGAMGNDWEGFFLTPGLNQIGFSYSSWITADYAPTIKVRYREVYL